VRVRSESTSQTLNMPDERFGHAAMTWAKYFGSVKLTDGYIR
jgi:hypothetical protein